MLVHYFYEYLYKLRTKLCIPKIFNHKKKHVSKKRAF